MQAPSLQPAAALVSPQRTPVAWLLLEAACSQLHWHACSSCQQQDCLTHEAWTLLERLAGRACWPLASHGEADQTKLCCWVRICGLPR